MKELKPKKNSRHEFEIKSVTSKGFGVGYVDSGFVVFVDGCLTGDVVDVHLVKVNRNYAYGKIMQIITPSPFRIKSPCAVSDNCGGCQWQHCEYSAQLTFKKKIVSSTLSKIGEITDPPVEDVIGMENLGRYRNKAVFPVVPAKNKDGFAIGMYAPRSHRLIEVDDCLIQHVAHVPILSAVKEHMRRHKITAYDEVTHSGTIRHIIVRTSLFTGEVMVVLMVNNKHQGLQGKTELTNALTALGVTTVLISLNNSWGNTILGEDFQILSGTGFIRERIGEVEYQISAPSFFQVNPVQTKILYETAIAQAQLDGTQTVIDAHVGAGGVALFAAKHAKSVLGVDIVEPAIEDAKKNAAINGIKNADFICGAAEDVIPKLMQSGTRPDVVFLDPPRKGCDSVLLDALIASKISKIVYISCDPATLARDIKRLSVGGYTLKTAQPVDMFPFTGKVETSVLLQQADS